MMMNPLVLMDPEGDALGQSLLALKGSLEVGVLGGVGDMGWVMGVLIHDCGGW